MNYAVRLCFAACLTFGSAMVGPAAMAARLRSLVQISGPVVHLSDLFSGLMAGQDCTLGNGPSPGSRLILEKPQLAAIANQFGVDWEPSPTEQTMTVDRPGRIVELETVLPLLKQAVDLRTGTSDDLVTLNDFPTVLVDLDAKLAVGEVSMTQTTGPVQAVLTASLPGQEAIRFPLTGTVDRLLAVAVPTHAIASGEIIQATDLSVHNIPLRRAAGDIVLRSEEIVGLMSTRLIPSGSPIARSDLRRPDIVSRGEPVIMRLAGKGIEIQAQGRALDSGSLSDRIRVLYPLSHAVLQARITGPNEVRIDPELTGYMPARPTDVQDLAVNEPWRGNSAMYAGRVER